MRPLIAVALVIVCLETKASPYTTVNRKPQLGVGEDSFSLYWAVWRRLTGDEATALKRDGKGALLARRDIRWKTTDCASGTTIHENGERFWFHDAIRFDDQGRVAPLREAGRPDYLYLSMAIFNGVHLRGVPFQSAVGTRGSVWIEATHRLFDGRFEPKAGEWVQFNDYRRRRGPKPPHLEALEKYAPDVWPVFYDERAHKPHTPTEPTGWADGTHLSEHTLRLRFDWEWCEAGKNDFSVHVAPGGLPPGDINRPGRGDAGGNRELKVVEDLAAE